jgi:hypothetical protein
VTGCLAVLTAVKRLSAAPLLESVDAVEPLMEAGAVEVGEEEVQRHLAEVVAVALPEQEEQLKHWRLSVL